MIPYGKHNINKLDIDSVISVLKSDFLTQGPKVPKFEKAVAKYCGSKYGLAVNSATSALHLACLALGLGKNDRLWTSPNTFVASANCGLYCGSIVDFVDIDPKTYNMSIDELNRKLIHAKKLKKLPKVVIPVHFAGQPCDMPAIHELSKKYGFKIIEDASHAIGASYNKIKVGACKHSDITIFSFHPVKIITSAEGGMAMTNNIEIFNKMYRLRTHGITTDKKQMNKRSKKEIWNYQQIELGFNYRMNDIQASLGLSQIKRLNENVRHRNAIAKFYNKSLKNLSVLKPFINSNMISSYHLYPIVIKKKNCNKPQKKIYEELLRNKIGVNLHYIPVHRHPYFERLGFKKNDFPVAEKFHQEAISIPIYPAMKDKQKKYVIKILKKVLAP